METPPGVAVFRPSLPSPPGTPASASLELAIRPLHDSTGLVALRDSAQVICIRRNRKCGGLGVEQVRLVVQVIKRVALLVVIHVKGHTRFTTEQLGLFFSLETLSAREDSASWDAVRDEGLVVGAAIELGLNGALAETGEVVFEQLLNGITSWWTGEVKRRPIAIIKQKSIIRRRDHIKVQIQPDLGKLGRRQAGDVVITTKQAEFLRCPEEEAHGVLGLELGESARNNQVTDNTRPIVVNARTRINGVAVAAERNDVVRVAGLGLRNDIVRRAVLERRINEQVHIHGALLCKSDEGLAVFKRDADNRRVRAEFAFGCAEGPSKRALDVVVSDCRGSIRLSSVDRFLSKGAVAALDEDDFPSHVRGECIGGAPEGVNDSELGRRVAAWRVCEGGRVEGFPVCSQRLLGVAVQVLLGLLVDIVVAGALELAVQPVDGVVVRAAAEDAVALGVGVCKVLELLGAGEQIVQPDLLLEGFLCLVVSCRSGG